MGVCTGFAGLKKHITKKAVIRLRVRQNCGGSPLNYYRHVEYVMADINFASLCLHTEYDV